MKTLSSVNHCAAHLLFGNHNPVTNMIKVERFGPSLLFDVKLFHPRSPPQLSPEVNNQICRYYKFFYFFYGSVAEISFLLECNILETGKRCKTFWNNVTVSFSRQDLFYISNLEHEPTVFSLNNGDSLPNHAPSDTRRAESFIDAFEIVVYLLFSKGYNLNRLPADPQVNNSTMCDKVEWKIWCRPAISVKFFSSYNCNNSALMWKHIRGLTVRPIEQNVQI